MGRAQRSAVLLDPREQGEAAAPGPGIAMAGGQPFGVFRQMIRAEQLTVEWFGSRRQGLREAVPFDQGRGAD
jgi:hypothetical protein